MISNSIWGANGRYYPARNLFEKKAEMSLVLPWYYLEHFVIEMLSESSGTRLRRSDGEPGYAAASSLRLKARTPKPFLLRKTRASVFTPQGLMNNL